MDVEVRVCDQADLDRLARHRTDGHALRRHRERYALQVEGKGWHLIAWSGKQAVGSVTVTKESKYSVVRELLGAFPEMNGLEANPRGRGIGTILISAAERLSASHDAPMIGLAAAHTNLAARALYERLGYEDWATGVETRRPDRVRRRGDVALQCNSQVTVSTWAER